MTRKRPQTPDSRPETARTTAIATVETAAELAEPPGDGEPRLVVRAIAAVKVGIGAIERAIAAATKALDEMIAPGGAAAAAKKYAAKAAKASSHVAWLTIQAAKVMGELRKGEAHDQAQLRKLTPAIVLEWYRQLEDDERADFARRLDRIDSTRRT